ncbi:type VI secretion protein ImpB [Brevundimonas sp.]|jgi:DNA polymerase-4|uniref:Y-family DNA polymerase n=1 Tax=Brevundimonas sp. TaxID=1871086 RepID=UPI002E163A2E|nr:type VI secretion protein ImpB [Brevundimonas sp.]
MDTDADPAGLRWLFIDLNSYFASVEQQMNPKWRGRPVIVRPASSEHTCAIAASYEAKNFGIKTGTRVADARRLCPGLIVAEARPDLYVKIHHLIMTEIDRHVPVWKVGSIDEASCRLTGRQRVESEAVALARRIQAGIKEEVGECLRSSIGLAPSRFLAKTACGMKKPEGLTVLRADALPGPLLNLPLSKFPGVGPRMVKRLAAAGIVDVAGFWALDAKRARAIWNGIEGERIQRGLHGLDSAEPPEKPRATISHSHVLAKEMRTPEGARAVARRLVVKCGARLRRLGLTGSGVSLFVDMNGAEGPSGWESSGLHRSVSATSDTFVLLKAVDALWRRIEPELRAGHIRYVGVGIQGLRPRDAFEIDLFEPGPDQGGQAPSLKLSQALDALNRKYGKDTVSIGPRARIGDYVGAKIAFNRIPDLEEFWE